MATATFPIRIEGEIDEQLSRWLWIVKWFLLIPHYVVLAVMSVGVILSTIVAWVSIIFTSKYPRWIFDYNVGVLQWGWRVVFYSYSALGTDQYPPFKLGEADYPASLEVDYPERLSRGLALIKWILAIPHIIIVSLLTSGAIYASKADGEQLYEAGFSLVGILMLIAGAFLLFANRYPRGLFDLVMGINRWSARVWSYLFLLHDEYPPFRMDLGGKEPEAARGYERVSEVHDLVGPGDMFGPLLGVGEGGVLSFQIGLGDRTGTSTASSYVEANPMADEVAQHRSEVGERHGLNGVGYLGFDEIDGFPEQEHFGLVARFESTE